jgi:hypothetical protein
MGQTSLQHHRPFTYCGTQRFVFLLLSLGYSTARLGQVVSPEGVIIAGLRSLHLWLTAVPMAMAVERIACRFADELRPALHNI